MAKMKTGEFRDKDNNKNKVSHGPNRFHLVGEFSGSHNDGDVILTSSVPEIRPGSPQITKQTKTEIDGTYHWERARDSDTEAAPGPKRPAGNVFINLGKSILVALGRRRREGGTISSSVEGSPPVSTNVVFPP